jgi:hypothetical protein
MSSKLSSASDGSGLPTTGACATGNGIPGLPVVITVGVNGGLVRSTMAEDIADGTSTSCESVSRDASASTASVDALNCLDRPVLSSSMSVSVNDSISGSSESSPHVGTVFSIEMIRCGS